MTNIDYLWSQVKAEVRGGRDSCPEFIEPSRVEKRDGLYNFSIFHLEVTGLPLARMARHARRDLQSLASN